MTWYWWGLLALSVFALGLAIISFAGWGAGRQRDARTRRYEGVVLLFTALSGLSLVLEVVTGSQVFGAVAFVTVLGGVVISRVRKHRLAVSTATLAPPA